MTPREILIGIAYIGQMIDFGDRDLQTTCVDQAGKFYEHLGIRRRAVALGLDAVFRGPAAKSMIVSIRSGAAPSSSARST